MTRANRTEWTGGDGTAAARVDENGARSRIPEPEVIGG
jgi:hypothetical protein